MKIALTIAGSDSGGGAGIQADLKTFHRFGVFGTSVIVAVTAQNTRGVRAVEPVSPGLVLAQLRALAEDLPPAALKTGMLARPEIVRVVAGAIRANRWNLLVVDPVMVSTSGHRLLTVEAEGTVRELLIPLAALVTPNLAEAEALTGRKVRDPAGMERAARDLVGLGARAVLVTGGHLGGDEVTDLLVHGTEVRRFTRRRVPGPPVHGAGCTLSAAIAAGLALGRDLETAVADAVAFVQRAIETAPPLGGGHRPVNHGAVPPPR